MQKDDKRRWWNRTSRLFSGTKHDEETQDMAKTTKTSTRTKTAQRKGAKTRTKRAAPRTARAKTDGRSLPRTAKGWAALLTAREARRPGFWRQVVEAMKGGAISAEYRAAQVEHRGH
jgi:hypothetical protein